MSKSASGSGTPATGSPDGKEATGQAEASPESPAAGTPARNLAAIPPRPSSERKVGERAPGERRDGPTPARAKSGRMQVGPGIRLKGEIEDCAELVVEGSAVATLDGERLDISQNGLFTGTARVETADIHGRFEGDLQVAGLLHIHGSGRVTGKVSYGRIEVSPGGELSGHVGKAGAEGAGEIADDGVKSAVDGSAATSRQAG